MIVFLIFGLKLFVFPDQFKKCRNNSRFFWLKPSWKKNTIFPFSILMFFEKITYDISCVFYYREPFFCSPSKLGLSLNSLYLYYASITYYRTFSIAPAGYSKIPIPLLSALASFIFYFFAILYKRYSCGKTVPHNFNPCHSSYFSAHHLIRSSPGSLFFLSFQSIRGF